MAANGAATTTRVRVITSFGPYWYLSCPSAGCTSKMSHTSETTARCNGCGHTAVYTVGDLRGSGATHRYRLKLRVVESGPSTGRVFDVVFFNAAAESLFGVQCADLIQIATASSACAKSITTPAQIETAVFPPSASDDDDDDVRYKDKGSRAGSYRPDPRIAVLRGCCFFPFASPRQ